MYKIATLLLLIILSNTAFAQNQTKILDSLNRLIKSSSINDTTLIKAYSSISEITYTTNPDSTLLLSKENIKRVDSLLNNYSNKYNNEEKRKLLIFKTEDQNNIAVIQFNKGNTSEALKSFKKNLKTNKELNDHKMVAITLINISLIYKIEEDYVNAISFAEESIQYSKKINLYDKIGYSYNSIGQAYQKLNKIDSAFYFYKNAIKIFDSLKLDNEKAITLNNIGVSHIAKKEFSNALKILLESNEIHKKTENNIHQDLTLLNIGECYLYLNQLQKAEKYLIEALELSRKYYKIIQKSKANELLSKVYEKQKKYKLSIEKYKTHILLEDSIYNKKNQKQLLKQQANLEYNIKAAADSIRQLEAIKVKNAEIEAGKLMNERQKVIKWYLFGGLGIVTLFGLIMYNRFKVTNRQKKKIELQEQKVRAQHKELEEVHNEIQASINYAKGLQDAILPSNKDIGSIFKEYFIFFKPKDIVSGDFYWLEKQNDITYVAIADCTGHGIPGAMVSIVCSTALSRSVKEFNLTEPSKILNKTREIIIDTFRKSDQKIQDGMDICLCAIKNNKITFSGAYNPLWIIRNGELIEYKSDRQPVGFFNKAKPFTQQDIKIEVNDLIYLMSDGFQDQFGGEKNKKFKVKNLKQLLVENCEMSLTEQKEILRYSITKWKGTSEQVDDITIMGIRF